MVISFLILLILTIVTTASKSTLRSRNELKLIDCESDECMIKAGDPILPCGNSVVQKLMPAFAEGFGTLGAFFKSTRTRDQELIYAITNAHVVGEGNIQSAYIGTKMCRASHSKGFSSDGFVFGGMFFLSFYAQTLHTYIHAHTHTEVVAIHHQWDVAIIKVYNDLVNVDCTFPHFNLFENTVMRPNKLGELQVRQEDFVTKYGARTGWTVSSGMRFRSPREALENIEIINTDETEENDVFMNAGDSGSVVLNKRLEVVGLLYGTGGDLKKEKKKRRSLIGNAINRIKSLFEDPEYGSVLGHDMKEILYSREIANRVGVLRPCGNDKFIASKKRGRERGIEMAHIA